MSKLFDKNNIEFANSIFDTRNLPKNHFPEFCFIGRSNVGKSSLINAIIGIKKIAKVSATPGKTISLNYFSLNEKAYIVDLPGYGYAKLPKKEQAKISHLIGSYFESSENLKLTFLLVDGRHEIKKNDIEMLGFLADLGREVAIIVTKCDKRSSAEIKKSIEDILKLFNNISEVVYSSAKSKIGISEIKKIINNYYLNIKNDSDRPS